MTEQPNELAEIRKLLQETADKIDTIRDELIETIDDNAKDTAAKIAELSAFQHNVLEPNQQKIWNDGIGELIKMLKKATEPEQETET